ncbi:MAG: tetratricopeptide repeat protein [Treponema sp.]|nr:tetratricopeptide repeat protein [Treponema sp.]
MKVFRQLLFWGVLFVGIAFAQEQETVVPENPATATGQIQAEPVTDIVPPSSPQATQSAAVLQESERQEAPHPQLPVQETPRQSPVTRTQTAPQRRQQQDALVLYQNGNYPEAISVCESELRQDPTRVESYVVLCWSLVRNRQYAEAEQRAADGLKVSPYDLRLIEIFGEAKYYLGKNNGALEQFQRYVASVPESGSRVGAAYYFMGEIYIRQARYQHADISLSAAVKKEPLLDAWWTRLGYAREMAGNYYESLAAYDEALLLNAASADARNGKNRITSRLQ